MVSQYYVSLIAIICLSMTSIQAIPTDGPHFVTNDLVARQNEIQKPMTCENRNCRGKQYWDKPQRKCMDCARGKVPDRRHRKCEDCPKGQKPNTLGDKCEKSDGNDNNNDTSKEDRFQKKKKTEIEKYKKKKEEEEKKRKEADDKRREQEGENRKKRNGRKNLCLTVFIGAGFLTEEELPSYEAMGGFADAFDWPSDIKELGPDISEANVGLEPIEQSNSKRLMVRKAKKNGGGDGCDDWRCQLGRHILNKISGGKLFPKNSMGKPTQINTSKLNKQNADKPADPKDTQAAKDSKGLQKLSQDKNYGLCLAGAALTFSTAFYEVSLTPDQIAAPNLDAVKPQPDDVAEQLKICLWDIEDDKSEENAYCWVSYADSMFRQDRVPWETCTPTGDEASDIATAIEVQNGCCAFYDGGQCDNFLFAATNRQDGEMKGDENDSISSFWCTSDLNCKGHP